MSEALPRTPSRIASFPRLAAAVWKRELRNYLHSPGTYVALAFFLLLSGAVFVHLINDYIDASTSVMAGNPLPDTAIPLNVTQRIATNLFLSLNFLVLLLVPLLTMRLLSEERRSGTFELLVSTPLGNWDILMGKFLASLTVGLVVLGLCGLYPLICMILPYKPELSVIWSSYIGLSLIIIAYTSFGLFASAVTESQIAAAVLSFAGLLLLHMIHWLFPSGFLGRFAAGISLGKHSEEFTKGVIQSHDVVYFLLFTVFFLFMSAQVLDARKWRA